MNLFLFLVLECLMSTCLSVLDTDISFQKRRLLGKKTSSSSSRSESEDSSSDSSSNSDETFVSTSPSTSPSASPTAPEYSHNDDSIGRFTFGRFMFEYFNQL